MRRSYTHRQLETVGPTHDIPKYRLKVGDRGAVVRFYRDKYPFGIEFVPPEGRTIPVLTLSDVDIRQVGGREVLHVRPLFLISCVSE